MEINIIKVGNSKGIIIPSNFLKLIGLKSKVNIAIEGRSLVISPNENPRLNWEKLFIKAGSKNDNEMLIPDVLDGEIIEDWTW
jgi:antitoxin MazE